VIRDKLRDLENLMHADDLGPSRGWAMRELEAGRLFVCARCRVQVVLCSRCDRGNVYCSQVCARIQRQLSLRATGARYQSSPAGRFAHAVRARLSVGTR
jgi:hypothetical protein